MHQVTVYFDVLNQATMGNTTITIGGDDEDRVEFLKACEEFFTAADRPEDAAKFEQAARQSVPEPS